MVTISEPFGLIPEEFYENKYDWYDCPGLFKWWCRKYHQPYSKEYVNKCVQILANYVAKFFIRAKIQKCYSRMVAFVRTFSSGLKVNHDHTHRRIIELASQIAKVHIDLLPPKSLVAEIVQKKGKFAWDMYGIAHPLAQEYLLNYLRKVLEDEN